jgi:toxin ParE1/3/4
VNLKVTPRAAQDLVAILEFLNERNPSVARHVSDAVERALGIIRKHPYAGRTMRRNRRLRVKVVSRYPYLIFYRIDPDVILVLHIRHGSRRKWKGLIS